MTGVFKQLLDLITGVVKRVNRHGETKKHGYPIGPCRCPKCKRSSFWFYDLYKAHCDSCGYGGYR